ncbi:origin recognition complex subunit 2-like isoform X2 [Paramacrobiotus metropolitanus]|nr:origin recognition complex subunit 2-like isoform X2 [Paramacrobiotus metropolitanus]XP_055333129.1 origin recognition complex subunit 2-like isoform X2 [Paramacrobiotus metropolitanus]
MARKLTGNDILAQMEAENDSMDDLSSASEDDENEQTMSEEGSQDTVVITGNVVHTPEHFQSKKRGQSPTLVTSAEHKDVGLEESLINVMPFHEVRKSLKFDVSPPRQKDTETDTTSDDTHAKKFKRVKKDTIQEPDSDEDDETPKTNAFQPMKPADVREIMDTVVDPWIDNKKLLRENCEKQFATWHFLQRKGFSILLHGVGSKKLLLDSFRMKELSSEPVMVIDGFKPECNLKAIFEAFYTKIIGSSCPKMLMDVVGGMVQHIEEKYEHFNILLHNIDGPSLRNSSSQQALRALAVSPKIHFVASMDHPNLPLLWSQTDLEVFNWLFFHCSTFASYDEFPVPDLGGTSAVQTSSLVLESLRHVFESLTVNAKRIYQEIVKYQLNHGDENASTDQNIGMPYNELYKICRAEFLVSREPILRKQLIEYYDHQVLRSERGADGKEYLTIPISRDSLKDFLDNCE